MSALLYTVRALKVLAADACTDDSFRGLLVSQGVHDPLLSICRASVGVFGEGMGFGAVDMTVAAEAMGALGALCTNRRQARGSSDLSQAGDSGQHDSQHRPMSRSQLQQELVQPAP